MWKVWEIETLSGNKIAPIYTKAHWTSTVHQCRLLHFNLLICLSTLPALLDNHLLQMNSTSHFLSVMVVCSLRPVKLQVKLKCMCVCVFVRHSTSPPRKQGFPSLYNQAGKCTVCVHIVDLHVCTYKNRSRIGRLGLRQWVCHLYCDMIYALTWGRKPN